MLLLNVGARETPRQVVPVFFVLASLRDQEMRDVSESASGICTILALGGSIT